MLYVNDDIQNLPALKFQEMYENLPLWRKKQVDAIKHQSGKYQSVAAFSLLQKGLMDKFQIDLRNEPAFAIEEHGKPYMQNHPQVYFNISHCKVAVACAISNQPIGVDVECTGRYREGVARFCLNDEEIQQVISADNKDLEFTKLWTSKEALLKCSGEGVSHQMKDVLKSNSHIRITTTVNQEKGYVVSMAE
ncbi:MAG: 4'-phosphopantetheinyl transferase superfamily protein [Bacteroidaceae bacterium]|nr:4'-phosphopantetheinyl transferase superfamily protein [Bacteroidaceae bacterium]